MSELASSHADGVIRILYVDDDSAVLSSVKAYLESKDSKLSVKTVDSVDCALAMLIENGGHSEFDMVVSDYQMPGKNGIEFLKQLRRNGCDLPFMIFTGRSREEVVIEALNNGAGYYLMKGNNPVVEFEEMIHAIRMLVAARWERQELFAVNQMLSAIAENATATIIVIDLEQNVRYINPAGVKTFGWVREELVGRRMPWLDYPEGSSIKERIGDLVLTGKVVKYEGKRRTKDGKIIDFDIILFPILDARGVVNGMLAILTRKDSARYVTY